MSKPRLLDLFSGAGGAAKGYMDAGFYVVGVDIHPQPHYIGDEFHQADALTFPLDGFDVIHASPPCQGYSVAKNLPNSKGDYPLLIGTVRERLLAAGKPWIIENVVGSPMGHFVMLCGTHFGLKVYRHRQFETSELIFSPGWCCHPRALLPGYYTVFGKSVCGGKLHGRQKARVADGRAAMGIDWMTIAELSQAIPPAYTEYIGRQLLSVLYQQEAM